jgi:hypothetical protein
MSGHDPTIDDGFEVTFTASFCFTVARAEVEGKSPFEVAALAQRRLAPGDFFVHGAGVELESADRTEFREACFKSIDHDFLAGLFTGDEAVVEDYLRSVPPDERADWTPTEDAESEV